jgi:putative Ca2+/H+ antiporter (TMEM165/GDT1 family)
MDWKYAGVVFGSVLLAEMGDKTQLATMLFASQREAPRLLVFFAAGAALLVATGLGVLAGGLMGRYFNERLINWTAGVGFILIGGYTLWKG